MQGIVIHPSSPSGPLRKGMTAAGLEPQTKKCRTAGPNFNTPRNLEMLLHQSFLDVSLFGGVCCVGLYHLSPPPPPGYGCSTFVKGGCGTLCFRGSGAMTDCHVPITSLYHSMFYNTFSSDLLCSSWQFCRDTERVSPNCCLLILIVSSNKEREKCGQFPKLSHWD